MTKQFLKTFDTLAETTADTIMDAFAHDRALGSDYLSRARIAYLCARKVTPTLIRKIEALVEAGVLERSVFLTRNKVQGYQYRINVHD